MTDQAPVVVAESSDIVADVRVLRERVAALEASIPRAVAARSAGRTGRLRQNVKIIAVLLSAAALGGATIVYGQSALEALFIRQDGNVGIGTNDPASRLTVAGNASIGTAAAAPPDGLLVQGAMGIGAAPRAGVKLDVAGRIHADSIISRSIDTASINAGSINAGSINLNGAPALAGLQKEIDQLKSSRLQAVSFAQEGNTLSAKLGPVNEGFIKILVSGKFSAGGNDRRLFLQINDSNSGYDGFVVGDGHVDHGTFGEWDTQGIYLGRSGWGMDANFHAEVTVAVKPPFSVGERITTSGQSTFVHSDGRILGYQYSGYFLHGGPVTSLKLRLGPNPPSVNATASYIVMQGRPL